MHLIACTLLVSPVTSATPAMATSPSTAVSHCCEGMKCIRGVSQSKIEQNCLICYPIVSITLISRRQLFQIITRCGHLLVGRELSILPSGQSSRPSRLETDIQGDRRHRLRVKTKNKEKTWYQRPHSHDTEVSCWDQMELIFMITTKIFNEILACVITVS